MAFEKACSITMTAGAAIALGRFVKIAANGRVIQAAAGGDDAIGVSMEAAAAAGDTIAVAVFDSGKVEIEAGAAIDVSAGAVVITSDSVGRAVGTAVAANRMNGYALTSAGAAGEFITALLVKGAAHISATGV